MRAIASEKRHETKTIKKKSAQKDRYTVYDYLSEVAEMPSDGIISKLGKGVADCGKFFVEKLTAFFMHPMRSHKIDHF